MIRKVYVDFLLQRLASRNFGWLFKRFVQFFLIQASTILQKPFCGPILVTFLTTYRCNYRCTMCELPLRDQQLKQEESSELSTEQLNKIIKECAQLGASGIGFTGGEPLLRPDIFELLTAAKQAGLITHLNTNGYFLNESNIHKIFEAKVDSLNISLDGATAQTHDTIRGCPGAFDKARNAIQQVIALRDRSHAALRLKIVTVLSYMNINEVADIISLSRTLKTDCIEFIPVQPFVTTDNFNTQQKNKVFLEKLNKTIRFIIHQKKQGIPIENSFRHLALFTRSFQGLPSPLRCFAGYNSFGFDCYGNCYPCMPWINWGKSVGTIKNISLHDFWYSADYTRRRKSIARCKDCYLNCQAELNLLFNL